MNDKPLHERLVILGDRPTTARAERIAGDLEELTKILDNVTTEIEEYADALDLYGEGDRDDRAEARDAFASSDLAHDLAKLGRFLDGLETETEA